MPDLNFSAFGVQQQFGLSPPAVPVVVTNAVLNQALVNIPQTRKRVSDDLAASLGSDAPGLKLNIVPTRGPLLGKRQ